MTDSKLPLADKLDGVAKDLKSTDTGVRLMYSGDAGSMREAAALLRQQHEALVQARGALLLDAMVDDDGKPFGTTIVALSDVEAAIAAAEDKS